jgi:Lrp/AsnC family transcriptional regulator for asnA, asnC and gidA
MQITCCYLQILVCVLFVLSSLFHSAFLMKDMLTDTHSDHLDELDIQLLSHLQHDGRKSFTDIATETRLAVSTVRNRLTRLIDGKVIQIIGRVEPERVGFHVYARIGVSVRPVAEVNGVAVKIAKLKEVSFLAMTSGEHSLEVNVMCRDNNHLTELLGQIHAMKGVFTTSSDMYLKVFKLAQPDLALLVRQPNAK